MVEKYDYVAITLYDLYWRCSSDIIKANSINIDIKVEIICTMGQL